MLNSCYYYWNLRIMFLKILWPVENGMPRSLSARRWELRGCLLKKEKTYRLLILWRPPTSSSILNISVWVKVLDSAKSWAPKWRCSCIICLLSLSYCCIRLCLHLPAHTVGFLLPCKSQNRPNYRPLAEFKKLWLRLKPGQSFYDSAK